MVQTEVLYVPDIWVNASIGQDVEVCSVLCTVSAQMQHDCTHVFLNATVCFASACMYRLMSVNITEHEHQDA